MPNVTAIPVSERDDDDRQLRTHFIELANIASTTYTYPTSQDSLTIKNRSDTASITLTVNGVVNPIPPGNSQKITSPFTSFDITATDNSQPFGATSIKTLVAGGYSPENESIIIPEVNERGRVQRAIDHVQSMGGGAVNIDRTYNIQGGIQITAPNTHLVGFGTLKDGSLTIGLPTGKWKEYDFVVAFVTFEYTTKAPDNFGIKLQNVADGRITVCNFKNCDKAIYTNPINDFQHARRIRINNNQFKNCEYCLYCDCPANPTYPFTTADFHFIDNQAVGISNGSHVYATGLDGLVMTNNTLFFEPIAKNPNKGYNLYVDFGSWVIVQGNNFFEAGLDSIYLSHVQAPTISGNNMAWPGQRAPGCGIRIKNGDPASDVYDLGSICNNTIIFPTQHGISIEDNTGFMLITVNDIRSAGAASHYSGSVDLTSIPHYGVNTEATVSDLEIVGNVASANLHNLLGTRIYAYNNVDKNGHGVLTVTDPLTTTLDASSFKQFNMNQSAATTITNITGGTEGKTVTLLAFNDNTTIHHSSNATDQTVLYLRDGVDTILQSGKTMRLMYTSGRWYEISRTYGPRKGQRGSLVFGTAYNATIGTITFPIPFPAGSVPRVELTLSNISTAAGILPMLYHPTAITETSFSIGGMAAAAVTCTINWTASID